VQRLRAGHRQLNGSSKQAGAGQRRLICTDRLSRVATRYGKKFNTALRIVQYDQVVDVMPSRCTAEHEGLFSRLYFTATERGQCTDTVSREETKKVSFPSTTSDKGQM